MLNFLRCLCLYVSNTFYNYESPLISSAAVLPYADCTCLLTTDSPQINSASPISFHPIPSTKPKLQALQAPPTHQSQVSPLHP